MKTPFVADDGWGGGDKPLEVGEVAGDSAEGTSGEGGPLLGELDGDTGDFVGADFGDSAGEGVEISGDGEAGSGVKGGDACGAGVTGVAAGGVAGDGAGGEDVASVFISNFIPWLQCPIIPQMKYLLPGEESLMTVLPSL